MNLLQAGVQWHAPRITSAGYHTAGLTGATDRFAPRLPLWNAAHLRLDATAFLNPINTPRQVILVQKSSMLSQT